MLILQGNFIHKKSQAIWTSGSRDNVFTRILKIQNGRHFCETCETQRDADYFAVRQLSQVKCDIKSLSLIYLLIEIK